MTHLNFTQPIVFEPLFMERIWGGRRLESLYGKRLPPGMCIGESWEIVDRPEAQSVVRDGALRGRTLHELWTQGRREIFGDVPDTPRFPLLAKLIDAQEKLSLQVHPPADVAVSLGGEPKTELWYIADATPNAQLFIGLKKRSTRAAFEAAIKQGKVMSHVHHISVKTGDAIFLPSGRLHALGAGNLIVEIQQNSDTTYRVYDWDRVKSGGVARKMHVAKALQSIDFNDRAPALLDESGESLVRHSLFEIDKWQLDSERDAVALGRFAIFICLEGEVECASQRFGPGDFFLVSAGLKQRKLMPHSEKTVVLRTTVPEV